LSLLYCHYCSVMHVTVMPVSAYMALAFVFGFIPNKLMMMIPTGASTVRRSIWGRRLHLGLRTDGGVNDDDRGKFSMLR